MSVTESNDHPISRHKLACDRFRSIAEQADDRWDAPSPCLGWNARDVLEHVIGFHEVLVLRPLGVRATRPKGDVPGRWAATQLAVFAALDTTGGNPVELDGGSSLDPAVLLPPLTTDVLVHTWDLAKAAGIEPDLDTQLCAVALAGARANASALQKSGMFAAPIDVPADRGVQARLVALLGREPGWQPEQASGGTPR